MSNTNNQDLFSLRSELKEYISESRDQIKEPITSDPSPTGPFGPTGTQMASPISGRNGYKFLQTNGPTGSLMGSNVSGRTGYSFRGKRTSKNRKK